MKRETTKLFVENATVRSTEDGAPTEFGQLQIAAGLAVV